MYWLMKKITIYAIKAMFVTIVNIKTVAVLQCSCLTIMSAVENISIYYALFVNNILIYFYAS